MVLRLYNSLTRKKEEFVPLDAGNVRMYVCGPTVYDHAHIGNARPVIVFDVLYRLLRHIYGEAHVKYVRNITDVDDKIMERASAEGVSIDVLTGRTTDQYHADVAALGCLPPDIEPRATEHVEEMKALIRTLIEKGHAYEAEGHVLFNVDAWDAYGELSGRSTDEMIAGARVEVAPYKKNPMDFVLWKPSAEDQPGWDSSWGRGRPGWHIECSAMAEKHLGQVFDIHGGGVDLKFPHHENEIAQSRCAFGTGAMAKVWMHNGFLQVEGEKMSKSLGNFVTIRDLLGKWPGDVLRFQMLKSDYRQPIDWTVDLSDETREELEDWATLNLCSNTDSPVVKPSENVINALKNDLNFPEAIAQLRELYKKAKIGNPIDVDVFASTCRFLGFRKFDKPGYFEGGVGISGAAAHFLDQNKTNVIKIRAALANDEPANVVDELKDKISRSGVAARIRYPRGDVDIVGTDEKFTRKVEALVDARNAARKAKEFAEADRIRAELDSMCVDVMDKPDGTTEWEIVR